MKEVWYQHHINVARPPMTICGIAESGNEYVTPIYSSYFRRAVR